MNQSEEGTLQILADSIHRLSMAVPRSGYPRLIRLIIIVIAIVLITPILLMMLMMPMMLVMGGMGGNGTMTLTPMRSLIMMLGGFVVLLAIGYVLYRALHDSLDRKDPALEELRTAYARGELTQEEFEQRKKDLTDFE